jgi:ornithine cyclodeaminase
MVAPGAHVNAVGAIVPARAEFEPALLGRCQAVVVDSLPQVQGLSREFREHYGQAWTGVVRLADSIRAGKGRPEGADVTLFKAMGMGVSDLALAIRCYRLAQDRGLGRPLPHPRRAQLRFKVGNATTGGA